VIRSGRAARLLGASVVALRLALPCAAAAGDDAGELATPESRASYSAGYAFGTSLADLQRGGSRVELEQVFRGVVDALSGNRPLLSEADRRAALDAFGRPAGQTPAPMTHPERRVAPARTRGFVDDFAALNAKREGVVVLPSGVQYEVLEAGNGRQPDPTGAVRVSYRGSLADGQVFDDTAEEGGAVLLRLDEIVVPGLREALLLMREGDRWRVVIPPAMGFGRAGNNLLRRRDLVYEIQLVAVEGAPQRGVDSGSGDDPASDGDQLLRVR
jgi:FKBP-type peptidyl-prolyl cis-trans isomerase FklB